MLTLEPPYPVIDGYALLPDHADKRLWYVLPQAPQLVLSADGTPELSITQYLGGGAGAAKVEGAILQLTTELAVPEDVLVGLAGRLPDVVPDLPAGLTVVPVPFDAGSVELAVLGRTATATASAAPGGPFEVVFATAGRPSLGGTNRATFQVMLNAAAAELLDKAIDAPEMPVLVTYLMTFAALRPGFVVDIHADWSKVYSSLRNQFNANAWIAAADVDIAVTRALETSGVDAKLLILGGDAGTATRTRDKLLDWVLERLFEPMAPPASAAAGIGAAVGDAVWSLSRAILPGVAYRLKVVDETYLRSMNVRATETVAENRELRPQGTLGGLLRTLHFDERGKERPEWSAVRSRMVSRIDLDGFPRVEVGLDVVDRFGTDGIRTVRLQLARQLADGTRVDEKEFAFTKSGEHHDYIVNLLDEQARGAALDTVCSYRVLVEFAADSPLRAGESATSEWKPWHSTTLLADPREAYTVSDVTVTVAPLFSFELFPAITVEARPAGQPNRTEVLQLTKDSPLLQWVFGTDDPAAVYEYRATYRRPLTAGGDVAGAWRSAVEPWLSLPDPMPDKLDVTFLIDLPWADITTALLQVSYDDAAASVRYERETITLSADTTVVRRTYSIAAGGSRSVRYRLTIKLARGGLLDGSWRDATDDRIEIDRRLVDERQVQLRVTGGTLAEHGLREARVELQVRAPDGAVRDRGEIKVLPGTEAGFVAPFSYLAGDPPIREVHHQVSTVDTSGFVSRQPWASTKSELLVLNLRTRAIGG